MMHGYTNTYMYDGKEYLHPIKIDGTIDFGIIYKCSDELIEFFNSQGKLVKEDTDFQLQHQRDDWDGNRINCSADEWEQFPTSHPKDIIAVIQSK